MSYSLPDIQGRYIVKAKVGDDVRVTHPDFETVHHTLTSSEDIKIIVENYASDRYASKKIKRGDAYLQNLDSANYYKKNDIEKSVSFIEKALANNQNKSPDQNNNEIMLSSKNIVKKDKKKKGCCK